METITLIVNTTTDENDGGEAGTGLSLRDAILITEQSPENNYIIELEGGSTYTLNVDSGDPGDNHLDLSGNVTIRATGDEPGIIDASGLANPDIVLHIYDDANVNLENLTITGGFAEGNDDIPGIREGGGLFINGSSTVTIIDSLITENSATASGGGISAGTGTTLTLINSEVSNNQSGDEGGGISVTNAEVNILSSTISNNTSRNSGGGIEIANFSELQPLVRVVNSTISGNVAGSFGGGIHLDFLTFLASGNDVVVEIDNSTITNNIANTNIDNIIGGAGGGIATEQDNRIAVANSIVTGNFDGRDNSPSDVSGFFFVDLVFGFVSPERSIIGDSNNIIGSLDRVAGTIGTGSDLVAVDPLLTPLQDNGGTILTHALLENSPAIDQGNNTNLPLDILDLDGDNITEEPISLDQIGSDRIFNETVDIGAVEFGSTSTTPNNTNNTSSNTVYRFFNQDTGVHFYTANEAEKDAVLELDNFNFEGGSYQAIDPLTGMPEPSSVYRFLNEDTGVHLYTISETERDATQELSNFSFEGEAFFAYEIEVENSIPIYRFFNPDTGAHFYTPSEGERNNIEANLPEFQSEGIAYYALPFSE